MKKFQTSVSYDALSFKINRENFERETGNRQPFQQKNQNSEFREYAICPSCLNPIQIIGLAHEIKSEPYGKHTGKSIKGFPDFDYRRYKFCPFADHKKHPNDDERLNTIDNGVVDLYNLLRSQFDRVVYVVSSTFGIRGTDQFWRGALKQFLNNKMYCYPWLTTSNLPYLFAYRGLHQQDLWGQQFRKNSAIYNALKAHPNVCFIPGNDTNFERLDRKNSFLRLQLRFSLFKQHVDSDHNLKATMTVFVDDLDTGKVVFNQVITFDEDFFERLIYKSGNDTKRQTWLLEIAKEMMPDIKPDKE